METIKVGDYVKCGNKDSNAKPIIGIVEDVHLNYVGVGGHFYDQFEKITNQELNKLLNYEIK